MKNLRKMKKKIVTGINVQYAKTGYYQINEN